MMKLILTFITCLCTSLILKSQQISTYNFYQYNKNYINPAATGCSPCKVFNVTDRHQWIGIKGAPSTQALSLQVPKQVSKSKKHGIGINVFRDANGAMHNLSAELLYSFHILPVNMHKTNLSFGMSGILGQYSMDERDFTEGIFDPIINRVIEVEFNYNASAGVYLYNEHYYSGLAIYNLLPVNSTLLNDYASTGYFITVIAGYIYNPRRSNFQITTSIYTCKGRDYYQADFNNQLQFKNNFRTELTLRKYVGSFLNSGQNALLSIGYDFKDLAIDYTYDLGMNRLQRRHTGSHQLSVAYKICQSRYACPTYK